MPKKRNELDAYHDMLYVVSMKVINRHRENEDKTLVSRDYVANYLINQ